MTRPLIDAFPNLRTRMPFVPLGDFPTPIHSLEPVAKAVGSTVAAWVKRDDLSSAIYGGNKVRTLEVLFGQALEMRATHIVSTGAFGTNHGAATVLHAPRVGLRPGLLLFPQPPSRAALTNFQLLHAADADRMQLLHWSQLPFGMALTRMQRLVRKQRTFVMVPGGATPRGALGYVSAALELAHQVQRGEMPPPRGIVVGVGSTCTSAGLLVGLRLAAALGIGWTQAPRVIAVRVTPWPVTSPTLIGRLAAQTSQLLERLTGDGRTRFSRRELQEGLMVDTTQLGHGYGYATEAGREAIRLFRAIDEGRVLELDTTYSGKAAASLIAMMRASARGPWLFWSTKSTAPLPAAADHSPEGMLARWWAERAERTDP